MKLYFISAFLFMSLYLMGQTRPFEGTYNESELAQEPSINPDSINYEEYTEQSSSFKALFNGKPGKAIMYGLAIPGGGQMYNRKYWKVPLAIAAESTAVYAFYLSRSRYLIYKNAYAMKLEDENFNFNNLNTTQLNNFRKSFQKQSEQAGVAVILVHLLVAVEAYIDRHLIDFDIDENLSFQLISPAVNQSAITPLSFSLSYRF